MAADFFGFPRIRVAARVTLPVLWSTALVALLAATWTYVEDDAFIHLEFARNLASGMSFGFKGIPTYGDSSPLWVFLLVGSHAIVGDWILAAKALSTVGVLFCLGGAFALTRTLERQLDLSPLFPYAVVTATIVNPYFALWAFSGMECCFALGMALAAIALGGIELPNRWCRRAAFVAVIGLAPLLRGELVMVSAAVFAVTAWRTVSRATDHRYSLLVVVFGGVLCAVPTVLWAIYALRTFGTFVPNTNAAKRLVTVLGSVPPGSGSRRLASVFLLGFGPEILACGIALTVVGWRTWMGRLPLAENRARWWLLAALLCWPLALSAFYLTNGINVQTRYVLLAGPFFTIVAAATIMGTLGRRRPLAGWAMLGAMAVWSLALDWSSVQPHLRNKAQLVPLVREFGQTVAMAVPSEVPIATYTIGQLGFELPNPIVDLGGLILPDAQHYLADSEATFRWARSRGASYFIYVSSDRSDLELLAQVPVPVVGWLFPRSKYDEKATLGLYRVRDPVY